MFSTHLPVAFCCCLGILAPDASAQNRPTLLRVDVENFVAYGYDAAEPSALAKSAAPVVSTAPVNFGNYVSFADIVAVNGSPAKGTMVFRTQVIRLTPTAAPGQAIGDITRGQHGDYAFEFLQPDGTQVGSIFAVGLTAGVPAPGSPRDSIAGNNTIVGGTGPFQGARGTMNQSQGGSRVTSQIEDPSMRRSNGGPKAQFLLQVFLPVPPQIVVASGGLAGIFHADWTPVNSSSPARSGETLITYTAGLGPTQPLLGAGEVFPGEPFAMVTSPVEVIVGGQPVAAINKLGVPGTSDTYRVDFRVPDAAPAGLVPVSIRVAWLEGPSIQMPVR